MSDSSSIGPAKGHPLVAWGETSTQEEALLRRVESKVLAHHDQRQRQDDVSAIPGHWSGWLWGGIASGTVALAALALVVWSGFGSTALAPLEAEGTLAFRTVSGAKSTHQKVRAELQAAAKVRDPQGWSLLSHAHTKLQIERAGARRSQIFLKQGAATFHVTPGKMKQFVVNCRSQRAGAPLQVVVKGTRFLVWRAPSGIRVEVFRGHVLLKRGGRALLHLYKGQGAFLHKDQRRGMKTYQIPSGQTRWMAKIEALAQGQSEQLFGYIQDLQQSKLLSPTQRSQALELAAHALQGAKRWAEASQLWLSLYRQKPRGVEAQSALFQAAQSCRRGRLARRRCVGLFQRYLSRFPAGLSTLREASLFWLGRLQLQGDGAERKAGYQRLQRYLKDFPKGIHATRARRLIARRKAQTPDHTP